MANMHMKSCSRLLATKEMQIKPNWNITSNSLGYLQLKKADNNKCWQGYRGTEPYT